MRFLVRLSAVGVNLFIAVLTFSACTPPLSEVLLLWDFLLAYGIHMNILAIISQLIILRDDILQHPSYCPVQEHI
jgi:cell cycle arrest protein BUB2